MGLEAEQLPWREVARIVYRHRQRALQGFVAVMALTTLVVLFTPPAYRSQAKLFVRLGRENATLDPTATVGQATIVAATVSRENELNTAAEILKSRSILEKTVDAVGPEVILETAKATTPDEAADQKYRAVVRLSKILDIEPGKKSNVLSISYDSFAPEKAQAIVAKVLDLFLDRHMQLSRSPGTRQFLAEQTTRRKAQLEKAEEELRDLKSSTGLSAADIQRQLAVTSTARIKDELFQAEAQLAASEAEVRVLREKQLSSIRQEPTVAALQAKIGALRAQIEEQRKDVQAINENYLRVSRMEREVAIQEAHYRRYAENLGQAQADEALEAERLSNISIVETATFDPIPVRPKKLMYFGIGFVLACACSIGLAFAAERLGPTPAMPRSTVAQDMKYSAPTNTAGLLTNGVTT
ncbi:MAG: GumC family protein [Gemmataceae bacterium]